MSPLNMGIVDRDNCWKILWFFREKRDITRRAERMQKSGDHIYIDSKAKKEELSNGVDRLLESLWQGLLLPGDGELKYDRHSKNFDKFLGKNNKVLENVANAWWWGTWVNTYKERDFSRWCAINVAICNCSHTSETHTENSWSLV